MTNRNSLSQNRLASEKTVIMNNVIVVSYFESYMYILETLPMDKAAAKIHRCK